MYKVYYTIHRCNHDESSFEEVSFDSSLSSLATSSSNARILCKASLCPLSTVMTLSMTLGMGLSIDGLVSGSSARRLSIITFHAAKKLQLEGQAGLSSWHVAMAGFGCSPPTGMIIPRLNLAVGSIVDLVVDLVIDLVVGLVVGTFTFHVGGFGLPRYVDSNRDAPTSCDTLIRLKLNGVPNTPNFNKAVLAAKYAGVELETQAVELGKTNRTPEYLAKFPWGRTPTLESPEGLLFESDAIALYIASKKPELVGTTPMERALITQFICNLDCELIPAYQKVLYPAWGLWPLNATQWSADLKDLLARLRVFDTILRPRTYLVGEAITVVDLLYVTILAPLFTHVLDAEKRKDLVNLTRYYVTIANQENVKSVLGEVKLAQKTIDPEASRPKPVAAATTAAANDDEEDEAPVQKKEKNAMDLLPPSKFNLEDWKRFYSNCKETRPVATNWFWEHFDREGFSIWRADYKYNEELKKIFMTCNLVTGLFARMDMMRKYCFGSVIIFGEDDKNEISGFFVFRGTEMPDLMKEVPDFECYDWNKVDLDDKKQVELFNDYLAWDGDLEGKSFNQGKIFK